MVNFTRKVNRFTIPCIDFTLLCVSNVTKQLQTLVQPPCQTLAESVVFKASLTDQFP